MKTCLLLVVLHVIIAPLVCCGEYAKVMLAVEEQTSVLHSIVGKFVGVALDTSVVVDHFEGFNMTDHRIVKLVSYLSPGYLRIGGTMADRLYFSEIAQSNHRNTLTQVILDGGVCAYEELLLQQQQQQHECPMHLPSFTMSGQQWTQLNEFATKVGTKILFDLNCLIRNNDGSWNVDNAALLIEFSNRKGYDIDWQLGNEPDAFKHIFNYAVNATQLAKDFAVLRKLLNTFPRYRNALLVGPETTRPRPEHHASAKYLKQFLETSDQHVLHAITFHQYYLNGRTAMLSDFLNPVTFTLLEGQLTVANALVQQSPLHDTPMWLTETASAYGGGAPGLSDTFAGTFLWLDKLGLAAKFGVAMVIRQSIIRGHYALINDNYEPTPDWWLSVLFNKFVGSEVISCRLMAPSTVVRLYCHCSAETLRTTASVPKITVFGINISNSTTFIQINNTQVNQSNSPLLPPGDAYILTVGDSYLTSNKVLLNGQLLSLSEDGDLPDLPKNVVDVTKPLLMPPYSLAFWVIPFVNTNVCSRALVTLLL